MTEIVKPLHVATIRGQQLRFFRSPNRDGRPDMPWHCCDDLYRCMGLPRELRRHFQRHMSNGKFRDDFRTIATVNGLLTIAPHYTAQGLLSAWNEIRNKIGGGASIENEYAFEGGEALKKLTAHLVFPDEVLPWAAAALKRHESTVP